MNRKQDISEKEQYQNCAKAYAKWFGVGSLVGTTVTIVFGFKGVSITFFFACLFGAIGYQLKKRKYENRK
ncbi:hypothetical protein [Parvicella tangerina]|uniref:Uncharacterized protein n=1 Tax=Parvicella tangerina TaxID=2829795 RepID=A0A916JS97_9FLAO|nr:hypothetical protein [Parvicella tangerina]CAG5086782.1 hypothetical protein CRYO30217_03276 [Parvicella tangerina]